MIVSERKSWEEILQSLAGEEKIFVLGCGGCSQACQTGGEKGIRELKEKLEEAGKEVTGYLTIDFLCNKVLIGMRLSRWILQIKDSDSLLVTSCGIGVQAVAAMVDIPIHPADNTVYRGGFLGVWPGEERCAQCGDCVLDLTGGICPITTCTKGLLNGSCGGQKEGKCEIDPDKDCGWYLIYERLKALGKLENLKRLTKVRDFSKMEPKKELKGTIFWALERQVEEVKDAA